MRASEAPAWHDAIAHHGAQVPYLVFQQQPSVAVRTVLALAAAEPPLDWDVQIGLRGWCRLRAGLPRLRALHGRRSDARFQECIMCKTCIVNATKHAIAACAHWAPLRENVCAADPTFLVLEIDAFTKAFLSCQPSSVAFKQVVRLADAIDHAAGEFWRGSEPH